ncbi:MAG: Rpp14/Pop5 family protein [Candidatus Nanohaloarchaea archaeon]
MKRLPPAIQEKHRYMEFRLHGESLELGEVVETVWSATLNYLGEKGSAEADFWVIGNRFNEEKQRGVIKVNRDREDDLRAAITLVEKAGGKEAFFEITGVSGTLKGLE